ncbi:MULTISPECIES: glycosyltransferase [Luteibacter]|uniref:glycosyltransferase n=1 Tax=Luteibacter TaxID=242605 RepID=UPI0005670BF9|nr:MULTISPECIES: glycosyltransferase [unclassified Luteibacter]
MSHSAAPKGRPLKTSVVVCTYNGQAYVAEQLNSLLAQSRTPDEIVIGDDASDDETWSLVCDFVARAEGRGITAIAFRNARRVGYVENFSRTLRSAVGDVIFLRDQDDVWHADKVAVMTASFEHDPALLFAHSDARLVDQGGGYLGHCLFYALEVTKRELDGIDSGGAFEVYLRRNLATGAASAFRRSLLTMAQPLPQEWVHDAWLVVVAAATGRVSIVADCLIDYRQHPKNQIGVARRSVKQRVSDLFRARNETITNTADRLGVLIARFEEVDASNEHIDSVRSMRDHLRRRLVIGTQSLWHRVPSVIQEWSTGRYTRFGTGIRSALRDLLRIG